MASTQRLNASSNGLCCAKDQLPLLLHSHKVAVGVVDGFIAICLEGPLLRVGVHPAGGLLPVTAVNQRQLRMGLCST